MKKNKRNCCHAFFDYFPSICSIFMTLAQTTFIKSKVGERDLHRKMNDYACLSHYSEKKTQYCRRRSCK